MAKYRKLERHGVISVGLELFKKNNRSEWDSPFLVTKLYVQRGNGLVAVNEADYHSQFSRGSRVKQDLDNGYREWDLNDLDLSEFYVKMEEEEPENAIASVE